VLELPSPIADSLSRKGRDLTVLVVRLGAMGDILRTLAPVRLLRRAAPYCRIYWALEARWSPVLTGHADLDGLVELPRKRLDQAARSPRRWPSLPGLVLAYRRRLRAIGADLVLDFHGTLRSGLTGRLSGAPTRVGYRGHQQKEGNERLNTHHVASGSRRTSRMERNLDLIRALGIEVSPLPPCELPLPRAGERSARAARDSLAEPDADWAVISPGASASQAYKKPPPELLAAACRRLRERGLVPLVVYGPGEEEDARAVVESSGRAARLAPPTDLATLAALIEDSRLFVGGDSGPMHLACAVGCPVLALYGPTDPKVNQPWGVPYTALYPQDRGYTGVNRQDRLHGFEGLAPERVVQSVDRMLDGR